MNDSSTKNAKRISEQLMNLQALQQETLEEWQKVGRKLLRLTLEAREIQELIRSDPEQPKLFE